MRKIKFAEWILSLTVAPDRAATTVGDLVEDASTRGALWFWSSVLWTALSHFARDLSTSPFSLVKLALWGWLAQPILVALIAFPVIEIWQSILLRWGSPVCQAGTCVYAVPDWVNYTILIVFGIVIMPFLAGWMVAQRSRGKELAAAFALSLLDASLHFLFLYLFARRVPLPGHTNIHVENSVITLCVRPIFVTAGAIFFRNYGTKRQCITGAN